MVETSEDDAALFRACGFEIVVASNGRFRCVRWLDATPAPDRALTLAELERAIAASWSAETADDPSTWTEENPARNHCDVTALFVRELLGGDILIANVIRAGRRVERHAWNRLPSGLTIDLTRSQFGEGEQLTEPKVAEPLASRRDLDRYALFTAQVKSRLGLEPAPGLRPPGDSGEFDPRSVRGGLVGGGESTEEAL